jgi:hypothetical protein
MSIATLSSAQFRRAAEIKDTMADLERELNQLLGETVAAELVETVAKKRRTMSAAGRKRVAAAQRAWWAKLKAAKK